MLKRALLAFSLIWSALGCGGSSGPGNNSDIVVHLARSSAQQDMLSYELYITNMGNTTLDVTKVDTFASTQNEPHWIDDYAATRSSSELVIRFRTLGVNAPYKLFVKVPRTANTTESLSLKIEVDKVPGASKAQVLATNATSILPNVQIDRNQAKY